MTGSEVKQLRLDMQLNQSQFADILGVQQPTISRWENSVTRIDDLRAEGIVSRLVKQGKGA